MTRPRCSLVLSLVPLLIVALVLDARPCSARSLRLCHTNDFHAKYLEVGDSDVSCQWWDSVTDNCYSGVSRLVTAFEQFRCDIRIQAGDWVQGSLLDTVFQQQIAIEAYRWANYDFAVFGNHEFDYGNGHINDTIRAIAPFTTWVSSNVFFDGDGMDDLPIYRWIDKYDICWVSILTVETMSLSAVDDNVSMEDETESLRKNIAMCKQQRNVIAITHQGYDNDIETCKTVKEIDLIIGGHSHTQLDNGQYPVKITREDGSICWVTTAYAHGRYVGIMDIQFDDAGVMSMRSSAYVAMDWRIKRDWETLMRVKTFDAQVASKADEVIGSATADVIGGQACRGPMDVPDDGSPIAGDCSMATLVCDSMLATGQAKPGPYPRVCLLNGGTFRNSFAEGDITLRDLINVLPFGNTIVSLVMTGKEIMDVLNYGFSLTATDNRGGYPSGLGNLAVSAHLDGSKPQGEMVTIQSVTLDDGSPLVETDKYTMLTNGYIAGGGDGYTFPQDYVDWGTMLRETVQTYLGDHDPYTPVEEPRIIMSGSETELVNEKTNELNSADADDASRFVKNEKLDTETELDETLVHPAKVARCRGRGRGGTCKKK